MPDPQLLGILAGRLEDALDALQAVEDNLPTGRRELVPVASSVANAVPLVKVAVDALDDVRTGMGLEL